jgi:hypothetical protein
MYEMKLMLLMVGVIGIFYVTIYGYKWLNKKGYNKAIFVITSVTLAPALYFIYPAMYPNDKFYKKEFEENTSILFPDSGVIIKKDAT